MEKFNELLAKLKELEIIQTKGDWAENIPDDIWNEYFDCTFKKIKSGLAVDTHRWYETAISVIEIHGGLLGIRHITNLFSESSGYEDCYLQITFHKMKKVQITSYECV